MGKNKSKLDDVLNNPPTILAIDPGTRKVGWAVFDYDYRDQYIGLWGSGTFTMDKRVSWIDRIDLIVTQINECIRDKWVFPDIVLIELPSTFISSAKGQAAANSGSVSKIMACVFQIKGMLMVSARSCKVELIPVQKWKGNVKKEITRKRIIRHWGRAGETNDEDDAIGIGDWYIRYVLKLPTHFNRKVAHGRK